MNTTLIAPPEGTTATTVATRMLSAQDQAIVDGKKDCLEPRPTGSSECLTNFETTP